MLKDLFVGSARNLIPQYRQFEAEARNRNARFIEAEHMLLAIARSAETEAGRLLVDAGLDPERIASILGDELRRTLASAGVRPPTEVPPGLPAQGALSLGTSAKAALRRALHASHETRQHRTRLDGLELLIGILGAELGTVPRAFAIAGIDRQQLLARARSARGVTAKTC